MAEIVTSSTPDRTTLLELLAQRDAEIRAKDLLIEKLKLQLANLRRHRFGSKSEALDHAIKQLELMLECIEASERPPGPAGPGGRTEIESSTKHGAVVSIPRVNNTSEAALSRKLRHYGAKPTV